MIAMRNWVLMILILTCIQDSTSVCTEKGIFPNENDGSCQSYIMCLELSNGILIEKLYSCSNGTFFNPLSRICEKFYKCNTPTSTESAVTTTITPMVLECTSQGNFPDTNDTTCTRFIFCYYLPTGKYIKRNYICPEGTKFDPQLQTCSSRYSCSTLTTVTTTALPVTPRTFKCVEQGRFPQVDDTTCQFYYYCLVISSGDFSQMLYKCPSSLKFDPKTETCSENYVCPSKSSTSITTISPTTTTSMTIKAPQPFECLLQGRFPQVDDSTCQFYYFCLLLPSGGFSQSLFKCPSSLKFDPKTQTCAENYVCPSKTSTSVTTISPTTTTSMTKTSPQPLQCVSQGRFPQVDDSTCQFHYYCLLLPGGGFSQSFFKCPSSLKFDPKTQTCAENYVCPSKSSTSITTISPTTTSTTTTSPQPDKCVSQGKFPQVDDSTCQFYYNCLLLPGGGFSQSFLKCPSSLKFDPKTQTCAENYVCPSKTSTSVTTISPTTTTSTTTTSPQPDKCVSQGRFPQVNDSTCQFYYYCLLLPGGGFSQSLFKCPSSLKFDPKTQTCAENYVCPSKSSTSVTAISPTTTSMTITSPQPFKCVLQGRFPLVDDSTCQFYYYCLLLPGRGFSQSLFKCPSSLKFDPKTQTCAEKYVCQSKTSISPTTTVSTTVISTTISYVCPSEGRFPDLTDSTCQRYFYCIIAPDGTLDHQIFKCPSDTTFDRELQTCSKVQKCSSLNDGFVTESSTFSILTRETTASASLLTEIDLQDSTSSHITDECFKAIVWDEQTSTGNFIEYTTDVED